jgi:uncharacterized protein GlcG (DUF336 family)
MENFWQQPTVTAEAALRLVHRAIDEGAARGIAVSVAVVDPAMTLIAFAKADRATPHSALTSRAKANASASTRRATGWMIPELANNIAVATGGALTNIRGGEPLVASGQVIGAIGIAGGTPDQDAEIAVAAVAGYTEDD